MLAENSKKDLKKMYQLILNLLTTYLSNNVKTMWKISLNFCGLLTKPQLYLCNCFQEVDTTYLFPFLPCMFTYMFLYKILLEISVLQACHKYMRVHKYVLPCSTKTNTDV